MYVAATNFECIKNDDNFPHKDFIEFIENQISKIKVFATVKSEFPTLTKAKFYSLKTCLRLISSIDSESGLYRSIADDELFKELNRLLLSKDDDLVCVSLELISALGAYHSQYRQLVIAAMTENVQTQKSVIELLESIVEKGFDETKELIESGLHNCLLTYIDSSNTEVVCSSLMLLESIFRNTCAHLLHDEFVEKMCDCLVDRPAEVIRMALVTAISYLENDFDNECKSA